MCDCEVDEVEIFLTDNDEWWHNCDDRAGSFKVHLAPTLQDVIRENIGFHEEDLNELLYLMLERMSEMEREYFRMANQLRQLQLREIERQSITKIEN